MAGMVGPVWEEVNAETQDPLTVDVPWDSCDRVIPQILGVAPTSSLWGYVTPTVYLDVQQHDTKKEAICRIFCTRSPTRVKVGKP